MAFIDRRRVQADGLIVGNVSETFSVSDKQLRIEAPRNHRSGHYIVVAVCVCSLRDVEELAAFTRVSGPVEVLVMRIENGYCKPASQLAYSELFAQPR